MATLTPVGYDPFEENTGTLIPVDFDPFEERFDVPELTLGAIPEPIISKVARSKLVKPSAQMRFAQDQQFKMNEVDRQRQSRLVQDLQRNIDKGLTSQLNPELIAQYQDYLDLPEVPEIPKERVQKGIYAGPQTQYMEEVNVPMAQPTRPETMTAQGWMPSGRVGELPPEQPPTQQDLMEERRKRVAKGFALADMSLANMRDQYAPSIREQALMDVMGDKSLVGDVGRSVYSLTAGVGNILPRTAQGIIDLPGLKQLVGDTKVGKALAEHVKGLDETRGELTRVIVEQAGGGKAGMAAGIAQNIANMATETAINLSLLNVGSVFAGGAGIKGHLLAAAKMAALGYAQTPGTQTDKLKAAVTMGAFALTPIPASKMSKDWLAKVVNAAENVAVSQGISAISDEDVPLEDRIPQTVIDVAFGMAGKGKTTSAKMEMMQRQMEGRKRESQDLIKNIKRFEGLETPKPVTTEIPEAFQYDVNLKEQVKTKEEPIASLAKEGEQVPIAEKPIETKPIVAEKPVELSKKEISLVEDMLHNGGKYTPEATSYIKTMPSERWQKLEEYQKQKVIEYNADGYVEYYGDAEKAASKVEGYFKTDPDYIPVIAELRRRAEAEQTEKPLVEKPVVEPVKPKGEQPPVDVARETPPITPQVIEAEKIASSEEPFMVRVAKLKKLNLTDGDLGKILATMPGDKMISKPSEALSSDVERILNKYDNEDATIDDVVAELKNIETSEKLKSLIDKYDKAYHEYRFEDGMRMAQHEDIGDKIIDVLRAEAQPQGESNAIVKGPEQEGNQPEHIGVPRGENLPVNQGEVRQGEGGLTGNRGGNVGGGVEQKGTEPSPRGEQVVREVELAKKIQRMSLKEFENDVKLWNEITYPGTVNIPLKSGEEYPPGGSRGNTIYDIKNNKVKKLSPKDVYYRFRELSAQKPEAGQTKTEGKEVARTVEPPPQGKDAGVKVPSWKVSFVDKSGKTSYAFIGANSRKEARQIAETQGYVDAGEKITSVSPTGRKTFPEPKTTLPPLAPTTPKAEQPKPQSLGGAAANRLGIVTKNLAEPGKERLKGLLRTMKGSEKVSEGTKKLLAKMEPKYEQQRTTEMKDRVLNWFTEDSRLVEVESRVKEAEGMVRDPNEELDTKGAVGVALMEHYRNTGNDAANAALAEHLDPLMRGAGRMNQAASMLNQLTGNNWISMIEKYLGKRDVELPEDIMKEVKTEFKLSANMKDEKARAEAIHKTLSKVASYVPFRTGEWIDAFRYTNMLSNPQSHERNIYGNFVQALITRPLSLMANGDFTGTKNYMTKAFSSLFSGEAFREAGKTYGQDFTKFAESLDNPNASILDAIRMEQGPRGKGKKVAWKTLTFIPKFLDAQDRFFGAMIRTGETNRLVKQGHSAETAERIAQKLWNKYLYREKLGTKQKTMPYVSRGLEWFADLLERGRTSPYGAKWLAKLAVPFLRTPIRLAQFGVESSPLGWIGPKMTQENIAKKMFDKSFKDLGDAEKLEVNEDIKNRRGLASIGTLVSLAGTGAALMGNTTWGPPQDKKAKELFYASGRRPYSFRIGNKWIPMSYLGPFFLAFAIPAAARDAFADDPNKVNQTVVDRLALTMGGIMKIILSQTPFTSVNELMETLKGRLDKTAASAIGLEASQFMPGSGLLQWINKMVDPTYRKITTVGETIAARIPGLSQYLEAHAEPSGADARRNWTDIVLPYTVGEKDENYEGEYKTKLEILKEKMWITKEKKKIGAK